MYYSIGQHEGQQEDVGLNIGNYIISWNEWFFGGCVCALLDNMLAASLSAEKNSTLTLNDGPCVASPPVSLIIITYPDINKRHFLCPVAMVMQRRKHMVVFLFPSPRLPGYSDTATVRNRNQRNRIYPIPRFFLFSFFSFGNNIWALFFFMGLYL